MRLTSRRQPGAAASKSWPRDRRVMLHVGCGPRGSGGPPPFSWDEWFEVRLDISPEVEPDIVADITDMPVVPTESVDGIWSPHNIEHVFAHEVPLVFGEFHRVMRSGGIAFIETPDIQIPAKAAANGRLEATLYESDAGPITALDMLYGYGVAIARGEHYMAHRTAFTRATLTRKLVDAGFVDVRVVSRMGSLYAQARRA